MNRPRKALLSTTIFFLISMVALCFPARRSVAAESLELGLNFNLLLPTHLPEFEISMPAVGPSLWIPLGDNQIRVQALFSTANNIRLLALVETGYYWKLKTPFFVCFFDLGIHYLHYEAPDVYDSVGGNGGFGLSIRMTNGFDIVIEGKGYLQKKPMVTFGGGFAFLL